MGYWWAGNGHGEVDAGYGDWGDERDREYG